MNTGTVLPLWVRMSGDDHASHDRNGSQESENGIAKDREQGDTIPTVANARMKRKGQKVRKTHRHPRHPRATQRESRTG